jgi:hypothetical protein
MFVTGRGFCQDSLPKFSILERGDKVVISWINPYPDITTLNIQRSYDSLRNFTTIFSAPSPKLPQNGYTDQKKSAARIFYRIYYVLESGSYYFTRSRSSATGQSFGNNTAYNNSNTTSREEYKLSPHIYANKDGYINILLPQINQKKYHVKFFEENGTSLFEIKDVKESPLILDKSSFIHAGWFLFELYEDNKLKEKSKLFLPKDF